MITTKNICKVCNQPLPKTSSQIGKSNVSTSRSHERRIAKLFTEWSGYKFRRRRVEGRDDTTMLRDATGDVVPANRRARFNIEAKKQKGFSLDAILNIDTLATNVFTEWWFQSNYDAILYTEIVGQEILPIVVFKPHSNWDWISFSFDALNYLRPSKGYLSDDRDTVFKMSASSGAMDELWFPSFKIDAYSHCGSISHNVKHTHRRENKEFVSINLKPCYVARWKTFAENVDPESFFIPGDLSCHAVDVAGKEVPLE